jgi:nitroreductase
MTDTIELLKRRRSVPPHTMSGEGPSAAEIETLLTIATRVADHGKLAPWRFIIIQGEARERLSQAAFALYRTDHPEMDADRRTIETTRFTRAPLVIAVVSRAAPHPKIPEWEQQLSAGAVCTSLIVAATAMGYGASWLTEWMAYDRRMLDILGLAPHERIAGFVHIGRGPVPADRPRPALADVVTRWNG